MSDTLPTFGQLIRHHRRRRGLRQDELAQAANLGNRASVSRAESPVGVPPKTARAIIEALAHEEELSAAEVRELALAYLDLQPILRPGSETIPVVGVILGSLTQPLFWSRLLSEIESALGEASLFGLVSQHNESPGGQLTTLSLLQSVENLAGIIISPVAQLRPDELHALQAELRDLRDRQIPIVMVDRSVRTGFAVPLVGFDNVAAGFRGVEYLLRHGHRRIAALFGLPASSVHQGRLQGYRNALAQAGIPVDERLIKFAIPPGTEIPPSNDGIRGGRRHVRDLLDLPEDERPTAIFSTVSYMTAEFFNVLSERHIVLAQFIPNQLSLLCLDDLPEILAISLPLTRIAYPIQAVGRGAVAKLLALRRAPTDPASKSDMILPVGPVLEGKTVAHRQDSSSSH